jgi:hypothetical protein
MFTRDVLRSGESEKEWKQLRSEMISSYCPVGFRKVRRVAKLSWKGRLRRLYRGEAGELAKLLADHETPAGNGGFHAHSPYNQAVADLAHLKQIEEQVMFPFSAVIAKTCQAVFSANICRESSRKLLPRKHRSRSC